MDDFNVSNLYESKNEWVSRLVNVLTPLIIQGIQSIFTESWNLCEENDEIEKYLMTFQNLLSRVPKWNDTIVSNEVKRIIESSGCTYLTDLITCVHIIQLKILTSIRVGKTQKKVNIEIVVEAITIIATNISSIITGSVFYKSFNCRNKQ